MAESIVASSIQWIGSLLIEESSMLFGVAGQVRSLQEELELLQQYLQDADVKQEKKEIDTLIRQIRKLAYEAEDVIDRYILEVDSKSLGNKGWFMKFACFLHTAPQNYSIGKQAELTQSDVKRVTDRFNNYGIRRITNIGDNLRSSSDQERYSRKQRRSYPYDDEGQSIVGLEKDVEKLVEVLTGEGKTQVSLVSIVGMGGSGKTTLARKLYNHPYAKECFECCAWIYISQEWSTSHVLSEILRKVSSPTHMSKLTATSSVEELVDKLRDILEKKSYLVVLDDVWRKDALEEILPALPLVNNNNGSKIIITTRNQEVVQFQNLQKHLYVHEPQPLSEEQSWELFCTIAFNYHTNYNNESYEVLGKEMLKKCDGLPLAIVALAGILNTKRTIRQWQQVSEAVQLKVMEGTCTHMYGRVGDMLALSYDDLPCELKPCFLYLGVFPEDSIIPTGMLTRMWIAEGLVIANEEISPEDVAMQLLEELSHRFMIHVVRTNYKGVIKAIHLHDLLRELCIRKAKEQSFLQINTPINNSAVNDASKLIQTRRAALHSSTCFPTQVSTLRSLVLFTKSTIIPSAYVSKETVDLQILHHNFKLLRLLNLFGIKTSSGALPTQIGSLIHLRYLGVRASNITELPISIGKLRNLLTLDYRNIDSAENVKIPNALCNLMPLRHLYLPLESPWTPEELKLRKLTNLQVLWGVKCLSGGWFSREIPKLSTSLKKLKVVVSTEKDLEAAFRCPSLISDQLHTFHCEWSLVGIPLCVTSIFSHNQHLHKLVLVGKIQSLILPSNLLILELKDSALVEDPMVVAGALGHLKLLRLSNSNSGWSSFTCNFGSFPQLEELYLENIRYVITWEIEERALASLKKLEILDCPSLHFPQGLAFATALQQLDFFGVHNNFSISAKASGWSKKRFRLPHNYENIIYKCDTPLHFSSIHKLHEQLSAGIFLNNKKMKFWIVKHEDRCYNCFMIYASNFSFTKEVKREFQIDELSNPSRYGFSEDRQSSYRQLIKGKINGFSEDRQSSYRQLIKGKINWTEMQESSDGPLIQVAKLESQLCMLNVCGEFERDDFLPQMTYAFSLVIMLDDSECVEEMYVETELYLSDDRLPKLCHKMTDKPRNEWLKVLIGESEILHEEDLQATLPFLRLPGGVEFLLKCFWKPYLKVGIAIKGIIIEPKLFFNKFKAYTGTEVLKK